jgi:hypothetical protein
MDKYRFPPWAGLAILFAIGSFAFVLPAWTDAIVKLGRSGISDSWAGFAGGLIGSVLTSVVAAVAIYFAYLGIREQIRVGVLAREEDRLVRELPGLRDAHELLLRIHSVFGDRRGSYGILDQFRELGFERSGSTPTKDCKALLPDTDDTTIVQVRRAISNAIQAGVDAEAKTNSADRIDVQLYEPDRWEKADYNKLRQTAEDLRWGSADAMTKFRAAIGAIRELAQDFEARIELYEARLPKIRRAMSEYFDR